MTCRGTSVVCTLVYSGALLFMCGSGTPASAQGTSSAPQAPSANDAKWEFEVHLGGAFGSQPTAGTPISTFPVGETFSAPGTGRPGRYASTWYFGDGATLINQIAASFPVGARIRPLDSVLTNASLERKQGLNFGGRVSRRLTPRFSAEVSVDSVAGTLNLSDAALKGIEDTRASFAPVWNAIIATGGGVLFASSSTSSTTALTANTDIRHTSLTGAVNVALTTGTRVVPYLTAGGGVLFRSGDLPSATLTGNYQFRFLSSAPLNESDVVTVRFAARDRAPVGVFGGGLKYALSPRQGLRVDLRVHLSPSSLDTLVDAQSNRIAGTPPFSIPSTTSPALVFSNTPATRSSLSGPAIAGLKTFGGSGTDLQTSLTAGYFIRLGAFTPRTVSAPRTPAAVLTRGKWEIEAHVGGGVGHQPTRGTPIGTFPVGESFTTTGFLARPSRYASTWYFGDGAGLLNEIGAGFGGSVLARTRVTPLDPVLTAASLERKRGVSVGGLVSRRLTRIVSGELAVESMAGSVNMTDGALAGLEATRASFTPMWNALLATGSSLFLNPVVTSTSTLSKQTDSRRTLVTGAANFELPVNGRVVPYATVGGGVLIRSGGLPTATLTGNYQFRFGGAGSPFNASDVVEVHFAAKDKAPVGLFGGGVKYALSARQGLRADVRVHISANSLDTLVNARPSSVTGTPAFSINSTTTPSLVFSNTAATRANLSGPAITDLKTFTGSGREIQTNLTVGYFVRF